MFCYVIGCPFPAEGQWEDRDFCDKHLLDLTRYLGLIPSGDGRISVLPQVPKGNQFVDKSDYEWVTWEDPLTGEQPGDD